MSEAASLPDPVRLTPHVDLRRVEIVVNPLAGSVGPKAAGECERLLASWGVEANIVEVEPHRVVEAVEAAMAQLPGVVVVLAGDGTARSAASMAGPDGPLIVPLPGGTMNLLPRALYGTVDWRKALERALHEGIPRSVAGGEVDGKPFYVAAILGSPALWAPAREAIRGGKLWLAYHYARRAARRAFSRRLRFSIDDRAPLAGEALALLSPIISKAMHEPNGLEAAVVDVHNAGEGFVLAAKTLFADWRADSAVETMISRSVKVTAQAPIPAILDGEPIELPPETEVRFVQRAFRALAPAREPAREPARALTDDGTGRS
jgi:diacylglycerol kinase family enzyme